MKRFEELQKYAGDILRAKPTAEYRMPSACLFLIPASSLMLDNDPMLTSLRSFFKKIQRFNVQPLVLISLADEQCPELRQNAMAVHPRVEEMRQKTAEYLKIPINQIFVPVNYTSETERDWNIDRNVFRIIEAAVRAASQKITADLIAKDKPPEDGDLNFGSYPSTPRTPRPSSALTPNVTVTSGPLVPPSTRHLGSDPDGPIAVAVGLPYAPPPAPTTDDMRELAEILRNL